MDMDMAHYLLTETKMDKENVPALPLSSKEVYRRLLAEKLLNNRMWIFAFRNKPLELVNDSVDAVSSHLQVKPAKQRCHIPQFGTTPSENKNMLKNIKYPSNLPSHGLLGNAAFVPFERLQVLLLGLGISFVGVALCLLHTE